MKLKRRDQPVLAGKFRDLFRAWAGRKIVLSFLGLGWPDYFVILSGPGLAAKLRYPFWAWPENVVTLSGPGLAGKFCYLFWAWAGCKIPLSFLGLGWPENCVILSGPGLPGKCLYPFWTNWLAGKFCFLPGLVLIRKFCDPFWTWPYRKIPKSFMGLGWPENSLILSGPGFGRTFFYNFWACPDRKILLSLLVLVRPENSLILSGSSQTGKFRYPFCMGRACLQRLYRKHQV